MSDVFTYERRVEFRDTDAAGILHFASYFAYMEEAEHAFLRDRGMSVMIEEADYTIGWPRVSATCDFRGAAKFEEVLRIGVSVELIGTKSISYLFRFQHNDRELAMGKMTAVCCRIVSGEPPTSIEIPDDLRALLATI